VRSIFLIAGHRLTRYYSDAWMNDIWGLESISLARMVFTKWSAITMALLTLAYRLLYHLAMFLRFQCSGVILGT
jgi:exosortase/archaeosortase